MSEYTYQVIDCAKFFIKEGMYSIKEVEQMLADMKAVKDVQDKALRKSIEKIK
jgi:hypothetical protein